MYSYKPVTQNIELRGKKAHKWPSEADVAIEAEFYKPRPFKKRFESLKEFNVFRDQYIKKHGYEPCYYLR